MNLVIKHIYLLFFFLLITEVLPQGVPYISINGKINNSFRTSSIYNTSAFIPFKKNNSNGVLDSLIYVFNDGSKGRIAYYYNNDYTLHYFTNAIWYNGAWSLFEKHTNTYNNDGNLESVLWESSVTGEWVKDSKDTYGYDSLGNRIYYLHQYFTGKWFESAFKIDFYFADTNLVTSIQQKWIDNEWINSFKKNNTYSSNNFKDSTFFYEWKNDQWVNYELNIYEYDEKHNIISNLVKRWQEDQWIDHAFGVLQYDVNNNLLLENWKIALNNSWENWFRIFYEYDDNNNLIYLTGQEWVNNSWVSEDEPLIVTNPDGISYGYLAKEVLLYYSNPTSVRGKKSIADEFNLFQNYPNPFNPNTTISYSLPTASNIKLEIYDVMGRMIKSFTTNLQSSGTHQVVWDGTNSNGVRVSSGIYIYRFEAVSLESSERFVKSNKLMLVK